MCSQPSPKLHPPPPHSHSMRAERSLEAASEPFFVRRAKTARRSSSTYPNTEHGRCGGSGVCHHVQVVAPLSPFSVGTRRGQVDLRPSNSWVERLGAISTVEMIEVCRIT